MNKLNPRQLRHAKRHKWDNFPQRLRSFLTLLSAMVVFGTVIGLVGRTDHREALYSETIRVCEQSHKVLDGPLERKCDELATKTAKTGAELVSQHGRFWVEINE